jgi:peptidyl-prolyl cis-trans isomerase SurA
MRQLRSKTLDVVALVIALCFFFAVRAVSAGEVIDRIVATVNGRIILKRDWDEALNYEALLNGHSVEQFTEDERRAVLDRLIDQELLREQMRSAEFQVATLDEAARRVSEARKQYAEAATEAGWQTVLARYHLPEKDLIARVQRQIDLMRLVDARLRPGIQIDSKSVEAYYRDKFVPQLRQSGGREVPLADVSAKIRELLTQQKVSELLVSWLQTLRSEGHVHYPGGGQPAVEAVESR